MPDKFAMYRTKWGELHPKWELLLWEPNTLPSLVNRHLYDNAEHISKEPWQFRSDVVRYEILQGFGGVWVDMDFEPHQPIDNLLISDAWVAWEETGRWVSNAIMAATPNHPFLNDVISGLAYNAYAITGGNTVKSGPQYITPIAFNHGIDIYPRNYFFPFMWDELEMRGSVQGIYATHHFWNRTKRLPDRGGF